uniref:Endonuclease III n=1 Tax=Candidatus Caldatribacterium californiense TaxID=1454726 RepID=A0A7V3YH52_9BACT
MDQRDIRHVFAILQKEARNWQDATVGNITKDPFLVLVGALLSHRTQDRTTHRVLQRLVASFTKPEDFLHVSEEDLVHLLYPVGFYREKARRLQQIARILLEEYGGKVPESEEELLRLPGVGRKTANLVLSVAFGKPAICVDTHVHRITNRWGLVATKTPEETERELQKKLPQELWGSINKLLVLLGQNICLPRRPHCSRCPVAPFCKRQGVTDAR